MEKVTKINSKIISKPHAHLQTIEKTCAKFQKDWYKIVCRVSTHCLHTYTESEVRKWHKVEKVTNINASIISKPHAHLQTMEKTCAKFQKDWYKIVCRVSTHCLHTYTESEVRKWHKVEKVTNINASIISKPHAHLQTMEKTCTKFQKDWYKIVWKVALTSYPLSLQWGRKMTKFTKWKMWQKNKLTIISKPRCKSSYHEENTCKVSKLSVQNCKRSCTHKTPRVIVDGLTNRWKLACLSRPC